MNESYEYDQQYYNPAYYPYGHPIATESTFYPEARPHSPHHPHSVLPRRRTRCPTSRRRTAAAVGFYVPTEKTVRGASELGPLGLWLKRESRIAMTATSEKRSDTPSAQIPT